MAEGNFPTIPHDGPGFSGRACQRCSRLPLCFGRITTAPHRMLRERAEPSVGFDSEVSVSPVAHFVQYAIADASRRGVGYICKFP